MKFLLYAFYFFRSVALRGLANTWRLLRAEMRAEKRFGIHTAGIKKSNTPQFFHYQGAPYFVLLRVLKEAHEATAGFDFTDIGCGKGRVLCVAEYTGYSRLTGIELDKELLEEAKQNVRHYALKRPDSQFELVPANALEFNYPNRPAVYFLFNPFDAGVLRGVLQRIQQCTQADTWFVYMNPLYRQVFEEQGLVLIKEFKSWRYLEAVIYRSA